MKQLIIHGKIQWHLVAILVLISIFIGAGSALIGHYLYDVLVYLIVHDIFYTSLIGLTSICAFLIILLCTLSFCRSVQILSENQYNLLENLLLIPSFIFFTVLICFVGGILKFIL